MSIQSTRDITREDAEERLIRNLFDKYKEEVLKPYIARLTNEELEEELDETFYNYHIVQEETQ